MAWPFLEVYMVLNEMIRKRRREMNLSQGKLSKLLGYDSAQLISNIERGVCHFPKRKLKRLCRVLMLDQQAVYNSLVYQSAKEIAESMGMRQPTM
jgi:transcriptional regulator with XRE-family HTH domain